MNAPPAVVDIPESTRDCYIETRMARSGAWSWQCFDCPAEQLGFSSLAEAEEARDRHAAEVARADELDGTR